MKMAFKVKKCKRLRVVATKIMSMLSGFAIMGLIVVCSGLAEAQAPKLTVAVAANLQSAMPELQDEFEQLTRAQITTIYGASGNLFTQIENGAPYDVLLSADMEYPRKLVSRHLADGRTLYRYAIGRLVLWTPAGTGLDVGESGMNAVLDPKVTKIAIANSRHAPYGQAAVEALKYFKLYGKVSSKLVMGESVSQAAQFVESGNAQLGFLPLSLVIVPEMKSKGSYIEVPIEAYPALDQGAVVLAKARDPVLAGKFIAFLKRPQTVQILKKYGFVEPRNLGR
jgi:molybdate transport system substrate-binding protein